MLLAELSISLQGNIFLLLLLAAIGVAAALLFYHYTLPPLPPRYRFILSALRAVSILMLLVLLFEPILHSITREEQRPVVAVIVDNSQSMSLKDNAGDRSMLVRDWLKHRQSAPMPSEAEQEFFVTTPRGTQEINNNSDDVQSLKNIPPDSIRFDGETTNLSQTLLQLKERLTKENIQAVVLVTDGNYNVGKNPMYDAEAIGIPLYTIGVGDTAEQKDVLVEKVLTNNLAYADTRVPVDVTIKSSGYNGERVEVTIGQAGKIPDRSVVTLSGGTREYPVHLFIEPHEEGMQKYTVAVSRLQGELTEKNNVRSFFIKILKSKLRVVLLAGMPSPDVSAIRQVLIEDEHLTIQSFVQKNSGGFYEGGLSRSALDSADCFVLIGFPSSFTPGNTLQQITETVERMKKPILFINSKTTDYNKLNALEAFLPFTWQPMMTTEVYASPAVNEKFKMHALIQLEEMSVEAWQQLPPIFKTQTAFRPKPESDVLAFASIQNVVTNEPLVAIRSVNNQKSFAVTGHGVWRWRLLAQGNRQTERFFSLLLTNAVRWLTTKEEGKNVRISPTKETFTTAEPIEFTAQVYDEQLRPVDNAELNVELHREKETFQVALNAIGNGRYEGSTSAAGGLGEGDYTYIGKAMLGNKVYGEDKGRFSVGQVNLEFIETKMNKPLLEQMAYRTKGKYYDITHAEHLPSDLQSNVKFASKELVHKSEIELWNWQYLVAIIVLLLGIEWFLRKRMGML